MKRRMKFLITTCLLSLSTVLSACGSEKEPAVITGDGKLPVYKELENPDKEGFHLAIFGDPAQQTVEAYQKIKDCGFRMVYIDPWSGTALDSDGLIKALECCEAVGLEAMFQIGNTHGEEPKSFLDHAKIDYTKYPAFKGIYAFDEPSVEQLDWLVEDMEKWENSIYKDHIYFVNFMWRDMANDIISEKYIQECWDKLISKNDDNILMYDLYPLYAHVDGTGKSLPFVREETLSTLETYANLAKEKDSKFQVYLQTYSTHEGDVREMVSANDARFQVAYNMAYGVQGFACFTYLEMNQFASGMISGAGKEQNSYYYMQEVFKELKQWEHVYHAFDYQGTMAVLGKERGYGAMDKKHIEQLKFSMKSHERIESLETEYDLLVGTFKDADKNDGFFITSYTDPYYMKDNEIKLTFKEATKALVYYNGDLLTNDKDASCYLLEDGVFEFDLEAGDYLFVIPVQ